MQEPIVYLYLVLHTLQVLFNYLFWQRQPNCNGLCLMVNPSDVLLHVRLHIFPILELVLQVLVRYAQLIFFLILQRLCSLENP